MEKVTAVILAAGLGTRMKTDLPKVLHEVASQTILGRTISGLKKAGIADTIAVVGYKAEMIEKLFKDKIRFVRQPELLGSGDALKSAIGSLNQDAANILVACGDMPLISPATYQKLLQKHLEGDASCTFLTCRLADPLAYGRIIRDEKDAVKQIVEEKDLSRDQKKIKEVNIGIYCFRRDDLEKFIPEIKINKKKKEFYLTDIIDILCKNRKKIVTETCPIDEAMGINTRGDLAVMNKMINRKNIERLMESGVTIIDPDTTFIDETVTIGRDTVIFPDTVIESDVKIATRCKIGPFTHLRHGTRISDDVEIGNFVEICRTEIGCRTKVKHHTYLGDTTVGCDVNIGAGTITANYDGKDKHRTVIEEGAFVGVGAVLIAPVKIGKAAKVGAGSVVTKNKDVPPGKTVIGIPAKEFVPRGK